MNSKTYFFVILSIRNFNYCDDNENYIINGSRKFGPFDPFQALKKVQKKKEEKKAAEKKDETTEKKLPKPTIEAKESEAPKQKRKFIKFKPFFLRY